MHEAYSFKNPNYKRKKWKNLKQLLNSEASYPAHTYTTIIAPPSLFPRKKYCDITGLQAKYTDPQTRIQYRTFEEYQLIKSGEITPALIHGYLELRKANIVLK